MDSKKHKILFIPKQKPKPKAELPSQKSSGSASTSNKPTPAKSAPHTLTTSSSKATTSSSTSIDSDSQSQSQSQQDTPGTYTDYKIFTPSQEFKSLDRKYSAFRLDSRKKVSLTQWDRPIKLNRKDAPVNRYGDDERANGSGNGMDIDVPLTPMLGLDGKPVIGSDGQMVMVGPDGRPAAQHARAQKARFQSPSGSSTPNASGKRKPFARKTKQVFQVSQLTRALRREERYPWVLEDSSGKEVWVSQLEDVTKSDTNAFMIPNMNGTDFTFVPAHRWYKMVKRPSWKTMGLEEAEEELTKYAKSKNPQFWLMHNKGKNLSASTSALLKGEPSSSSSPGGASLGPGGRRLKLVDSGEKSRFEQDDEFGEGGKGMKKEDDDADMDEVEFEEDFADDDEGGEMDAVDSDDAKELESRMKKEYAKMDKGRERKGDEVEDEEEEEDDGKDLTGAGRDMRKLVRKLDKNAAREIDKEENPYASSEESEEDDPTPEPTGVQQTGPMPQHNVVANGRTPGEAGSGSGNTSKVQTPRPSRANSPSLSRSRAASPQPTPAPGSPGSPGSPVGLGASLVAKRATSPKPPNRDRDRGGRGSRAVSPLADGAITGGRGSRAGSPTFPASRAGSPSIAVNGTAKRKADDVADAPSPTLSTSGKLKKRRTSPPSQVYKDLGGPLTEKLIVDWIARTPNATSKDCIAEFKKYMHQPGLDEKVEKERFTGIVKRVAVLRGGVLGLRDEYKAREGTAA